MLFSLSSPSSLVASTSTIHPFDIFSVATATPASPSCSPLPRLPLLPHLSSYWPRIQFPARPQGLFPVCPGAGGNLSRETNCLVAASCEHLAQLGTLSRVTPPETECGRLHTQKTCTSASAHNTHTLTAVLPSALYNYGPQGNVM